MSLYKLSSFSHSQYISSPTGCRSNFPFLPRTRTVPIMNGLKFHDHMGRYCATHSRSHWKFVSYHRLDEQLSGLPWHGFPRVVLSDSPGSKIDIHSIRGIQHRFAKYRWSSPKSEKSFMQRHQRSSILLKSSGISNRRLVCTED